MSHYNEETQQMLETKQNKNEVELIKSGQGNIFSYFLSLKNYNTNTLYIVMRDRHEGLDAELTARSF